MFSIYRLKRTARAVAEAWRVTNVSTEIDFRVEAAAYEHACEYGPEPLPRSGYLLPAVYSCARTRFAAFVCAIRGHAFEDDGSYAGPESAADSFSCRRCHFHFHHTYY